MNAVVFAVEGFESVEALGTVDVLRRGGVDVKIVGFDNEVVTSAQGIKIVVDDVIDNVKFDDVDIIILPGGAGTKNYEKYDKLKNLLKEFAKNNKYIASICAAPTVLAKNGILKNKKCTCYKNEEYLNIIAENLGIYEDTAVVVDGNIITSRSIGTTVQFALCILEVLTGLENKMKVQKSLQL